MLKLKAQKAELLLMMLYFSFTSLWLRSDEAILKLTPL